MGRLPRKIAVALLALAAVPAIGEGPQLPAGLDIPEQQADGSFRTINAGIDGQQTVWHVRSALNVAALSCHDAAQAALVEQYNTLIVRQRKVFRAADAAIIARFQTQYPDRWQAEHDLYMTRLYNFFSQPLGQTEFCVVAARVSTEAAALPPGGFTAFAPGALVRLEAPFLALYRRYDEYRRAYADWQRRATAATATAGPATALAAATVPPPPAPPRLAYADLSTDAGALSIPPIAAAAPATPRLSYDLADAPVTSPTRP